ncbi:uncharacterized protein BT62DRAFT_927621 [Guyanagaster necrorhizus]|uniref:Uncharacterized protein n=1 Tax=Guyanagaster necrorhizus TaxID=856835 RepID=A0A9P8AW63_9AGAR|nr:uncharacterized protein BT62DRAFT_927621 [Guyanagaster necrorhizus MCA 3950]KAG7450304.1 hypothetical protein BT62DRAFT_927621 [Guyanagaster necrorhizus MCA 3950]
MHADPYLTSRAEDDKGISSQTIIIIAVCASVGGLVLLVVFVRTIRSACARSAAQTAPLPPVQPLAHHREHQLAKFYKSNTSRPSTTYDPSNLAAPRPFASDASSIRTSKASLLVPDSPGPNSPSRHASSLNAYDAAEDISLNNAPMELDVPNPSFQVSTRASSSTLSSSENSHTPPETPPSQSSGSISRFPHQQTRSLSSAKPASARRPRPLSLASSTNTVLSKSSRTNLRTGISHGPHNVQIVLPAPLAPDLYPNDEISPYRHADDGGYSRLSVVDQWAPRTYRSEGSLNGESRRSFGTEPRPSTSSQTSIHSQSLPSRHLRKVKSNLSSNSLHHISSSTLTTPSPYHSPPPVPRIPSMYNNVSEDDPEAPPLRAPPRDVNIPAAVHGRAIFLPDPDEVVNPQHDMLSKKNANFRGRT